ncbi:uncharacterized protein LOC119028417 [Acanthopagrus latus]|uniref:uncharacterized protein LOC119028417 n=1 Tax=Acanthopagrus latus TaxID=8177 RepID=UPI00187C1020|nr:uncharacterized protein LOC119028417 [Acanthopagrus latus]XP_036970258.1 uncharacterized protein LOC119028417 [Acanthopagrus latus]XP_036970259.1 uncharacterized protein LOC119028417 [Acanthopagrus latus]
MTAVGKDLIRARPANKEFHLSSNVPFLDSNPDAFSTRFQEDFQPSSPKKTVSFSLPTLAQVDHKDVRYIKEYLTDALVSYKRHPLPQITRIPRWTALCTNFKMQTDDKEDTFLTTQSQKFQPQPFQARRDPILPVLAIKKIQEVEWTPESTSKASFTPQHVSPVVKATVKHLEKGFPTFKGDGCHRTFVSQYSNTYQGAWSRAAQSVEKHTSCVAMGDPLKIVERETTHAASFSRPAACRLPVVRERLKLNLGNFSKDSWSCTSSEDFCYRKPGNRVVLTRRNKYSSSLPKGDIGTRGNKERMSVTTNRISFPKLNFTVSPVNVPEPDLITKSHVQFSLPCLSGLYYTTTVKEHYSKLEGERARPVIRQPVKILSGPEHGLNLSTTKTDYLPLKTCRFTPPSPPKSNIRFPQARQHISTTHSEDYTTKPLIPRRASCSQFISHFVVQ